MAKQLFAGALRHRVNLKELENIQDPDTGAMSEEWVPVFADVPAEIEPISTREFMAAAQLNSTVIARIRIRYRSGVNDAMRVFHGATEYKIKGILPDANSGKEWLYLMVETA